MSNYFAKIFDIIAIIKQQLQQDSIDQEMATHFPILAWDIPWNRGTWRATIHGIAKEVNTTEGLSTNPCTTALILFDGK